MSVGFSTIRPLDPSTISKAPAFSVAPQQSPVASSPIDGGKTETKKSHWFRNTIITLAVLTAAVGLGRKYLPQVFNSSATLTGNENIMQKGLHYVKKYIGVAGDYVNTYAAKAVQLVKDGWNKLKGMFGGGAGATGATGTTGVPTP